MGINLEINIVKHDEMKLRKYLHQRIPSTQI